MKHKRDTATLRTELDIVEKDLHSMKVAFKSVCESFNEIKEKSEQSRKEWTVKLTQSESKGICDVMCVCVYVCVCVCVCMCVMCDDDVCVDDVCVCVCVCV